MSGKRHVDFNAWAACCIAMCGLASVAVGKEDDQKSTKTSAVDANGKKITVINFEEASIEGGVRRPDGALVESGSKDRLKGIIDLRKDFRLQMKANGMSRK